MRINYLTKQDIKVTLHYLGYIISGIGVILSIPMIVDLIYGEYNYQIALIPCVFSILLGHILVKGLKKYDKLKFKHGMIISGASWLWAGLIGAIIMMLILDISFLDAFFENISAWTGSGLTLFNDVESLPMSILFLRSFEQWIGGLGVVVIFITIMIKPGMAAFKLYKSEARDEKIKPNIKNTLKRTLFIYAFYTLLGIVLYLLAGLGPFDAINLTFTTISTGGMSIKNANVGYYQNNVVYMITIFLMLLGATSFTVHYNIIRTRGKALIKDVQVQLMVISIILSCIFIALFTNITHMNVVFHIVSAITTTGANIASSSELGAWQPSVLIIIMVLMVMGGSSGSTVGAVKLIRIITFLKSVNLSVTNLISPGGRVVQAKISNRPINEGEMKEATTYIAVYLMFLFISWIIMTYYTNDPINALFDTTSTIGNVGLSTGVINAGLDPIPKVLLIFLMWLGRLEIIPVLLSMVLGLYTVVQSAKVLKKSIKRKINRFI